MVDLGVVTAVAIAVVALAVAARAQRPGVYPACDADSISLRLAFETYTYGDTSRIQVHSFSKKLDRKMAILLDWQETVMSLGYFVLPSDTTFLCLKPDRCYMFKFVDESPEGTPGITGMYAGYSATDVLFAGYVYQGDGSSLVYCTPGDEMIYADTNSTGVVCRDDENFRYEGQNCADYLMGSQKRRNKCNQYVRGYRIYDMCVKTCGRTTGLGDCGFLYLDKKVVAGEQQVVVGEQQQSIVYRADHGAETPPFDGDPSE
jgi:hypothetical protein